MPADHDEADMLEHVRIGERVAVDRDQVGGIARRDPADLIVEAEQMRRAGRRRGERLGGA